MSLQSQLVNNWVTTTFLGDFLLICKYAKTFPFFKKRKVVIFSPKISRIFYLFLTHAEMSTWLTTRVLTSLRSNQTFECWWLGFANNFAWICISPPACCGTSCWWQHQRCLWDISSCREFQNFHPVMQSHPSHPVHSTYSTEVLHPSEMAFLNGSFIEQNLFKTWNFERSMLNVLQVSVVFNHFQ